MDGPHIAAGIVMIAMTFTLAASVLSRSWLGSASEAASAGIAPTAALRVRSTAFPDLICKSATTSLPSWNTCAAATETTTRGFFLAMDFDGLGIMNFARAIERAHGSLFLLSDEGKPRARVFVTADGFSFLPLDPAAFEMEVFTKLHLLDLEEEEQQFEEVAARMFGSGQHRLAFTLPDSTERRLHCALTQGVSAAATVSGDVAGLQGRYEVHEERLWAVFIEARLRDGQVRELANSLPVCLHA